MSSGIALVGRKQTVCIDRTLHTCGIGRNYSINKTLVLSCDNTISINLTSDASRGNRISSYYLTNSQTSSLAVGIHFTCDTSSLAWIRSIEVTQWPSRDFTVSIHLTLSTLIDGLICCYFLAERQRHRTLCISRTSSAGIKLLINWVVIALQFRGNSTVGVGFAASTYIHR